jgi:hypothetical protein
MVSLLKLNSCRPWETNIAGAMERGNDRERERGEEGKFYHTPSILKYLSL